MFILKLKMVHFMVFCMAIAAFGTSVFAEMVLAKEPCQLCLISRYAYLSIALIALSSVRWPILRILLLLAVVFGLSFGLYHLGVENHWWIGPRGCISKLPTLNDSGSDFLDDNRVYCDRVNWLVFGVSSTLWNFLLSACVFWLVSVGCVLHFYLGKENEHSAKD
ncbi:MAG: disulfide bond formation protein B [Holosporales bacterium]|nr:disulfide bond formation protein B [Holosporales bacterium]